MRGRGGYPKCHCVLAVVGSVFLFKTFIFFIASLFRIEKEERRLLEGGIRRLGHQSLERFVGLKSRAELPEKRDGHGRYIQAEIEVY